MLLPNPISPATELRLRYLGIEDAENIEGAYAIEYDRKATTVY